MKTKSKLKLLTLVVLVTAYGCKKDKEIESVNNPASGGTSQTSNMANFFTSNGVPIQSFSIDASTFELIEGNKGTKISIPSGSFLTQGGAPINSGNIQIELREIFSKKDMILSGIPTMANKLPLISGGEIFIKAMQNGSELKLASKNSVTVEMPTGVSPDYNMQEFYSSNISATDSTSGWSSADSTVISVVQDTTWSGGGTSWPTYYYFQIDSMNWINCDYFWYDSSPKTDVMANLDTMFNSTNCVVFLSVDGINSIASMYFQNNSNYITYNFPIGKAVTFIAIAEINGQYYSAFISSTLVNNHIENITMNPTTLSQINSDLAGLP